MEEKTLVALADPAFHECIRAAAANSELVQEFDRITGSNLSLRGSNLDLAVDAASGRQEAELARFLDFVRDAIYERISPIVVAEMR